MSSIFNLRRSLAAGLIAATTLGLPTSLLAETTIRIGHVLADTHSWHQAAQGFAT